MKLALLTIKSMTSAILKCDYRNLLVHSSAQPCISCCSWTVMPRGEWLASRSRWFSFWRGISTADGRGRGAAKWFCTYSRLKNGRFRGTLASTSRNLCCMSLLPSVRDFRYLWWDSRLLLLWQRKRRQSCRGLSLWKWEETRVTIQSAN